VNLDFVPAGPKPLAGGDAEQATPPDQIQSNGVYPGRDTSEPSRSNLWSQFFVRDKQLFVDWTDE
jgi:hypothetical protein